MHARVTRLGTVTDMISCRQQETMISQQTQTQRLTICLEMGEGNEKRRKSKEGVFIISSFFFFCFWEKDYFIHLVVQEKRKVNKVE